MTLIEQIKADREAGTAGPFDCHFGDDTTTCDCRYILAEYGGMGSIATIDVCEKMDGPWGDDIGPSVQEAKANARRFNRVPDMEAALLAADELAKAVYIIAPFTFKEALAAYRRAIEGQQQ